MTPERSMSKRRIRGSFSFSLPLACTKLTAQFREKRNTNGPLLFAAKLTQKFLVHFVIAV